MTCSRKWAATLVAILSFAYALAAWGARPGEHLPQPDRQVGYGLLTFNGLGPERWAQRFRRERRRTLALHAALTHTRQLLNHNPTVTEAIELAAATYGSGSTLWRRARCESGLNRYARSSGGALGLFQFLPSTFASTPYAGLSIFSPYANALAAGWMIAHGRGGEWACR